MDLPAGATAHTTAQLTLPDVITELDLLLPDPTADLPDLGDLPFNTDAHVSRRQDITLDNSQFLHDSVEHGLGISSRDDDDLLEMEEDLGLDIGEDSGAVTPRPGPGRATTVARPSAADFSEGISFEIGREAPPSAAGDDLFSDSRMEGLELEATPKPAPAAGSPDAGLGFEEDGLDLGLDDDTGMGFAGDLGFGDDTLQPPVEATPAPEGAAAAPSPVGLGDVSIPGFLRERSDSPLSSVRSSVERETSVDIQRHGLDVSYLDSPARAASEDVETAQATRGSRKRKIQVLIDAKTEIKGKQIKAQQNEHSDILIEPSFLPRDPGVLALMSLTRTGALAHSVFYPKNMAPELANLLAPEFVKKMADLKRKRESQANVEEEEEEGDEERSPKQPKLILDDDEDAPAGPEELEEADESRRGEMLEFPEDEPVLPAADESDLRLPQQYEGSPSPQPQIEAQGDTSAVGSPSHAATPAPPVAISRETRQAVHVLREQFSEPAPKKSVRFQELLPPRATTKGDATKMFFEVLVLATKDAVKVKQDKGFGDIEIAAKKALWGEWAEERDEQQVAEEQEKQSGVEMIVGRGRGRVVGEAAAAS